MSVSKIADRYAKSLLDLVEKQAAMEVIIEDVKGFIKLSANLEFASFLKSPIIHAEKKLEVFEKMLGGKVHPELMNFFQLVIRKGRENILPDILQVVLDRHRKMMGLTTVGITSAVKLTEGELKRIAEKLKMTELVDQQVEYVQRIDPKILGGFIIEIGDKRYDASVAGKVRKIRKQLIEK